MLDGKLILFKFKFNYNNNNYKNNNYKNNNYKNNNYKNNNYKNNNYKIKIINFFLIIGCFFILLSYSFINVYYCR